MANYCRGILSVKSTLLTVLRVHSCTDSKVCRGIEAKKINLKSMNQYWLLASHRYVC